MPKSYPIPQDPIGETFVWRDWFQRLSNKVFGTAAAIDVPVAPIYGGTGQSTCNTGDIFYSNATDHITRLPKPTEKSMLVMTSAGVPSWLPYVYGSFSSTTTQSVSVINTPTLVTFDTTDYSSHTSRTSNKLYVDTAGLYNVQFSLQATNSDAQAHDADIWIRKNGTDIANSASVFSVHGSHGGQPGYQIVAANFFIRFAANDYVEFWWSSNSTQIQLNYLPAITTPFTSPGAPSIVCTISYVND